MIESDENGTVKIVLIYMRSIVPEAGDKAGTVNYVPQYLWDVIICPCLWYLLLAQHSSYHMQIILNSLALNITVTS